MYTALFNVKHKCGRIRIKLNIFLHQDSHIDIYVHLSLYFTSDTRKRNA